MLVVSDASPLNVLIRLGHADILAAIFKAVVIPPSVQQEMSRSTTPPEVRQWVAHPPPWLSVQSPANPVSPSERRHRGEEDAIRLALELNADAILLDEEKARIEAARAGLRVIGTVGILEQAADMGLISDLKSVHDRLRNTDFFIRDSILIASLQRHLDRLASRGTPPKI
jgi:predicted nucleic acid-binding protein